MELLHSDFMHHVLRQTAESINYMVNMYLADGQKEMNIINVGTVSLCSDQEICASPAELLIQAKVLQRCTELYFHTRLIRIRDEFLCGHLRRIIWVLSVLPLFRGIRAHNDKSDTERSLEVLLPRCKVTLSQLESIVQCGEALFTSISTACNSSSTPSVLQVLSIGTQMHKCLSAAYFSSVSFLEVASSCNNSVTATCLMQSPEFSVDAIRAGFVALDKEYTYAKLQSILHSSDLGVSDTASRVLPEPSVVFNDVQFDGSVVATSESYCWCRQGDDGKPMVGCDLCEEWFHCACVGISEQHMRELTGCSNRRRKGRRARQRRDQENTTTESALENQQKEGTYVCIACSLKSDVEYVYAW